MADILFNQIKPNKIKPNQVKLMEYFISKP